MKILIVKTSSMGDVIHALPVAADMKRSLPGLELHWLVEESFQDLPRACPFVDKVIASNLRKWRKSPFSQASIKGAKALREKLKAEKYDAVVDLQGLIKSAVLGKLASAPFFGYDRNSIREPLASLFYNRKFAVSRKLSAVERNRQLASKAFGYSLSSSPEFAFKKDASSKVPGRVVFFLNTSRETKLWPEEKWIELARRIPGVSEILLPWGSEQERERVERVKKAIGSKAVVPERKPISELISLIQSADGVVGVDTGMTHLSAALGTPTVGIFRDYPIELVPLCGNGRKIGLGGVNQCPSVSQVLDAFQKVVHVPS